MVPCTRQARCDFNLIDCANAAYLNSEVRMYMCSLQLFVVLTSRKHSVCYQSNENRDTWMNARRNFFLWRHKIASFLHFKTCFKPLFFLEKLEFYKSSNSVLTYQVNKKIKKLFQIFLKLEVILIFWKFSS